MGDRGASLVESVVAVTVLGVGASTVLGAWHTLALSSATAHQRAFHAAHVVAGGAQARQICAPVIAATVSITPLDSCAHGGPRRVRVEAGAGQSHRHLTMIVDGGP